MCNKAGICKGRTIQCPKEMNGCYIDCNGDEACAGSTIMCPHSGECYVQCRGENSCNGADVHWGKKPEAMNTLECDESKNACKGVAKTPINPGSDYDEFWMHCHGDLCAGREINCPWYHGCHVRCYGKESCVDTTFGWRDERKHSLKWLNEEYKGEL